jgi:hypothetical protein
MKPVSVAICFLFLNIQLFSAVNHTLKGTVKGSSGTGISGVKISLVAIKDLSATTDAQGAFVLSIPGVMIGSGLKLKENPRYQVSLTGNTIHFSSLFESSYGHIDIFTSNGRKTVTRSFQGTGTGKQTVVLPEFATGLNIVKITVGDETSIHSIMNLGNSDRYLINGGFSTRGGGTIALSKKAAAAIDTILASKTGFKNAKVPLESYDKQDVAIIMEEDAIVGEMPLVYDRENSGLSCKVATSFPALADLKAFPTLQDLFMMEDGTRISTKAQWACRRAEISAQLQHWLMGTKPVPPAEGDVSATFSNNKLTVIVKVGSKTFTISSTIAYPSTGTAPYPVIIKMDAMMSVPENIFTSRGCAIMGFSTSALVPSAFAVTRGSGTFYTLFPDNTAGGYAAFTWGCSRLIDGLFLTKDQNKIDVKHIAVCGCSYCGKMALYCGAFDERIALTIPQESGGGGEASWRVYASLPGAGINAESEDLNAAQGTGWYSANLKQFSNSNVTKLPIDQHELVAMIAPRAVLAIGNTKILRLGPEPGYVSLKAATEVWKALGVPDRIGYHENATGDHCAFPSNLNASVENFVDRFLLGKTGTNITTAPFSTDMTKWVKWETPTLK